jgi:hypothetical protein
MFRWLFLCIAFSLFAAKEPFKKVDYRFSKEPVDVVIPCAPKDLVTLEKCIEGIKKNGKQIRRVIVLSKEPMTANAEWFSEDLFPFSKRDIALELYHGDVSAAEEFLSSPHTRIGWIFQQLLKLYTPFVIPNISSNVLILDSDVIFLKPVRFMSKEGEPYFIPGTEYYAPYFEHAARLLPGLKRVYPKHSGIAHHMLFQKPVLEDLFRMIQEKHKMDPWRAICRCVDPNHIYLSCMSEYEIYFNFIQLRSDAVTINSVKWTEIPSLHVLNHYERAGYTYVACPEWYRKKQGQLE